MTAPRRSRHRWSVVMAVMLGVLTAILGGTLLVAGPARSDHQAGRRVLGPGLVAVRLVIRYSHFAPDHLLVRPHTTVRFEVHNHDPIGHEFIIGGPEVHARHESGHDPVHGAVPGEVSVGPDSIGVAEYTFHAPGSVLFACHLPGHFAYGMKGEVVVQGSR